MNSLADSFCADPLDTRLSKLTHSAGCDKLGDPAKKAVIESVRRVARLVIVGVSKLCCVCPHHRRYALLPERIVIAAPEIARVGDVDRQTRRKRLRFRAVLTVADHFEYVGLSDLHSARGANFSTKSALTIRPSSSLLNATKQTDELRLNSIRVLAQLSRAAMPLALSSAPGVSATLS